MSSIALSDHTPIHNRSHDRHNHPAPNTRNAPNAHPPRRVRSAATTRIPPQPPESPTQDSALSTQDSSSFLSPQRLRANKSNARRSTGPRTEKGKQRSSQNARTHGLCATTHAPDETPATSTLPQDSGLSTQDSSPTTNSSARPIDQPLPHSRICTPQPIHPTECSCTFETFRQEYLDELHPTTPIQHTLADQIISIAWRLLRIPHAELQILAQLESDPTTAPCETIGKTFATANPSNPFLLLNRYERSLENALLRLTKRLTQLKEHPITPPSHREPHLSLKPSHATPPRPIPTSPTTNYQPTTTNSSSPTQDLPSPRAKNPQTHNNVNPSNAILSDKLRNEPARLSDPGSTRSKPPHKGNVM